VKKDKRHRARETALQILYQWEVGQRDVAAAADTVLSLQWADAQPPSDAIREFATALAQETVRRLGEIDALIAQTAEHWRPERMAVLDRLILRMAIYELLQAEAPAPVIINEALELARTFSTEDAVRFINGMLDTIRKKLETATNTTAEPR
jgi:transcription antitermination protein NusB